MDGTRLGPYRIDRELGSGGMGKVYAATVTRRAPGLDEGTSVALKVVHPHLLETEGFFMRFMREAQLGASIQHENVVRTHMCDQVFEAGRPHAYLVMEYVEGQDLRGLLKELERVPEELCRHIGREIAKGLGAIHDKGVVHRDLKPENVIVATRAARRHDDVAERPRSGDSGEGAPREGNVRDDVEYVVKIMDLGVALVADEQLRLSHSGAFVGSAEYAAPEQFGGEVDHRCDLHALGLVLYELSCGQHPYRADDFRGVMKKVCEESPRRLGDINPQLSAFFEEVVHTLLAKSRDERFESAATLLGVLEEGEDSAWWHERAKALQLQTKRPLRRIRIPRETAVYGRDKELERLRGLYEQAKSGDGQVVVIEGEAGIGKSRLVDELIARLQANGEDLNFLLGSYPPGGAASAAGAFSTAFREQMGEAGAAEYLPQTPLLVPAFEAVLRGDVAPTGVEALTKDSLVTCFVQAARVLGAERPTVILIDDLHFAPEEARSLFSALAIAVPGHRVLLIGTTRPGVEGDWRGNLARYDHVHQMQVERLFPKDLAALLGDCFKSKELALGLAGQIGIKSDGNPFFAFEIIRGLREGQFITQKDDGTWASTRVIDEIQIPSSVLDLVNARVADLTEEERNVLDVAACWGFEFDPLLVGDVLEIRQIPLMRLLAHVEKKHRLVRAAGRRFVFDHHQVQEALYAGMPELLREPYHAALAEALETRTKATEKDPKDLDGALCVDLCEHYLRGAREESALRYLAAAQTHLRKGYLNAQAIALSERALAVPGLLTGTERARALLRLVGALSLLGRRAREEECAREVERLAEEAADDALRGHAANALGLVFWRTSRYEEAGAAYRRALELARARGDQLGEASATRTLGSIFAAQGRLSEAREHQERALALSLEIGDRQGEASATGRLGDVFFYQGRLSEAQEHQERARAIFREIGDRQNESVAAANLGAVLSSQGRLAEAREHQERALALSREIGDRDGEATTTGNLGIIFKSQGRLSEARELYERELALSREIGDRRGEAISLVNLGPLWHLLGDRARARAALEESVTICREIGARYPEGYGLLDLGRLADEEGDGDLALRLTQESLALRREIGHGDGVTDSLTELGDQHLRAGRVEPARAALEEAVTLSRKQGRKAQAAEAQALLACLPGGDAAAALAALGELAEHEDSAGLRWVLHRATGDRAHLEAAKRLLDEALAKVPEEYHEAILTSLRVNREILAAWRRELGGDEPRGTESMTRVVPRD